MISSKRDHPWKREELILALDLYMKNHYTPIADDPDVVALSSILQKLPIHPKNVRTDKFRNTNSISMKCANFQELDEEIPGGLSAGSKLGKEIWEEFHNDQSRLKSYSAKLKEIANQDSNFLEEISEIVSPDESKNIEVAEGEIFYRLHKYKERNSLIVRKKKNEALEKKGCLVCEVCGFDFQSIYGELGEGFIECHHAKPISELQAGEKTRMQDLVLVCSNCHRMLHRKGMHTITAIQEKIQL